MRPASIGKQPGEAAEARGLAGAVRSEHGDDLARLGVELDVEVEAAERAARCGRRGVMPVVRGVPPPSNRSRRPTSTANDTATSTRLSMIASSGLASLAR